MSPGKEVRLFSVAACLLLALLMGAPLRAQIDTGRIQGIVKDSSGAVVPGSKVVVRNEGTGLTLSVITGATGYYVFPGLRLGSYTVSVEASGFSKFIRSGVTIHVQEDAVVDVALVPGALTQKIEVKADAPLLQTQNASTGQVFGSKLVNDLPLNGRDWTSLSEIGAGATYAQNTGTGRTYVAANGTMTEQNDYRLNGIDNNDYWAAPEPYVALPPPDAIAEFKVETGNYSAELGRSAGLVVNATVKTGTNQLHGDLWEYVRNDKFDAAQFYENEYDMKKGPYRQNQFGGTLGGPVYIPHLYDGRNKTFFFFAYQGTRIHQAATGTDTVPTASMISSNYTNLQDLITLQSGTQTDDLGRVFPLGAVLDPATTRDVATGQMDPITHLTVTSSGFVRDPFYQGSLVGISDFTTAAAKANLNLLPAARLDSNAQKLLRLYPAPNQAGTLTGDYAYDAPDTYTQNGIDFRADQNFSARDQMFVVGSWYHRVKYNPPLFPGVGGFQGGGSEGTLIEGADHLAASETHFFSPTMINEFRLGYSRAPVSWGTNLLDTMGIPEQFGIQGIPQIAGNGGLPDLSIGPLTNLGTAGWTPIIDTSASWDLTENLTKVSGSHTLKAGFQGDYINAPIVSPPYSHGYFDFWGGFTQVANDWNGGTGIAQLALTPTTSSVGGYDYVGGADSVQASNYSVSEDRRRYIGLYFQDDWKVTQKLTANLGLRWDHTSPYYEAFGAQANFVPGTPGAGAEFLIPQRRCSDPRSASFNSLMQKDGIAVTCSNNLALGNVQNTNFAPRLGLAYRLDSKLVMRAGFGMFYGGMMWQGFGPNLANGYPFLFNLSYNSPDTAHPITYPNGSIGTLENGLAAVSLSAPSVNAQGLSLTGRQLSIQTPYFEDYNFALQYQLTPNQSFSLAYVGNQSHHDDSLVSQNAPTEILTPGLNPQNYVPFPDFARNSYYDSYGANSYYHSMQASFERRFSSGLNFLANYTYSKCRTDWRSMVINQIGGYRASSLPGFGIQGDYGLCDADVTNLIHLSGTYDLPVGKGRRFLSASHGVVNQVIGGWNVNWLATIESGMPFSIACVTNTTADYGCNPLYVPGQSIHGNGAHTWDHWLNYNAFTSPQPATSVGQTGFAPLGGTATEGRGPGERRLDFSVFKEFPITESKHFEFRAEFFNLTNTPWFSNSISLDYTDPTYFGHIWGLVDGANDPREIQLALKFYW